MKRKVKDDNQRRRLKRRASIRKKALGSERPRLSIYRSAKHIYAQIVDDDSGTTLASASTQTKGLRDEVQGMKKTEAAEKVGKALAEAAKAKGVSNVVFDRGGWAYHGRVAALAKGARDGGLEF